MAQAQIYEGTPAQLAQYLSRLPRTAKYKMTVMPAVSEAEESQGERITFLPLDRAIIERSNSLTTIGEMHDRQIVATALELQDQSETVAVLTKDANITASGVVAILWQ